MSQLNGTRWVNCKPDWMGWTEYRRELRLRKARAFWRKHEPKWYWTALAFVRRYPR